LSLSKIPNNHEHSSSDRFARSIKGYLARKSSKRAKVKLNRRRALPGAS
jgi:hypothetical protein